ncbi:MAG TPA: hypothetical protein VH300_05575 [Thermoleophilaceae bacterium]|nr:hypothetical protein [Thermoleophilaceae bacterium]
MLRLSSSIAAPPRARSDAPPPPPTRPGTREPRKPRIAFARLAPVLAAVLVAAVWLAIRPHTVDMAAHTFRADLFGEEGFTIWNGLWYGGHHTPAYSVLFPPLGWLLGPWVAGALATVAAAALFEPLARRQWGKRGSWAALWFGLATGALLFTGRLPFAMGVAFGLGALLALQRGRRWIGVTAAVGSGLASPVAALFLTLAAVAWGVTARGPERRRALTVALAAFLPPALLAAAFPEGGYMPFDFSTYVPVPLMAIGALVLLPKREKALRVGAAIYAVAATAAFFVQTPMGSNAVRLGALFAAPIALAAARRPRTRTGIALFVLLLGLLGFWQWSSAARDFLASQNEPSAKTAYYKPLLRFLATKRPEEGRVEIPFTRSHWEAAVVAPHFPLARGWERQLDAGRNSLFYSGILTNFTYANWLAEHGVAWVALPDVKPDDSSFKERGLIEDDPPYLRLVKRLPHWRIYAVTLPHPMVIPEEGQDIRLTKIRSDEVELDARTAGTALVRVRWSPYWRVHGGCVARAGDWTRVTANHPGKLQMTTSFSLSRVFLRGRRCG